MTEAGAGDRGPDERVDVIEFGAPRRRRWPRVALPVVLVAAVAVAIAVRTGHPATPSATPSAPPSTVRYSPPGPAPAVTDAGHPLLGSAADWDLYGLGPQGVVRLQFAPGRVTRTALPPLDSTGPVSFTAGHGWVVVRPLDNVPGYVVRDGSAATALTADLADGGPAMPGPAGAGVWIAVGSGSQHAMRLVGVDGEPTGPTIPVPDSEVLDVLPDGTGNLVLYAPDGIYLARPGGRTRITTGTLLATGPTRWVVSECAPYRCLAVIDRATGARRPLGGATAGLVGSGVVSPDGGYAAVTETDPAGVDAVHLVNLVSGADRRLRIPVSNPSMAWSPDGRWLFLCGTDGRLYPVEAATGTSRDLGVDLPPLTQVAIG